MTTKDQLAAVTAVINDEELSWDATLARVREIMEPKEPKIVQITCNDGVLYGLTSDGEVVGKCLDRDDSPWFPLTPQDTPVEAPDPIAELEKLRGLILIHPDPVDGDSLHWLTDTGEQERIGYSGISVGDIHAAAARLLARVREAKS